MTPLDRSHGAFGRMYIILLLVTRLIARLAALSLAGLCSHWHFHGTYVETRGSEKIRIIINQVLSSTALEYSRGGELAPDSV